jgi:hypothetical protein
MIVGRCLGLLLAALVAIVATGCATSTAPPSSSTRPVGVLPDPGHIFNDTPQGGA